VNDQIDFVAEQIANVTELKDGFDAIGFSQAGQFLRAYVERYNSPPVHNLITFGSQHMGVSDIPPCRPWDLMCQAARRAARSSVYSHWAQTNIVQAQYYRDPDRIDSYFASNKFLADINNEIPDTHNATYAKNLSTLNKLVLVLFSKDVTVVPKESSWFGSYAPSDESFPGEKTVIPMRMQDLYVHDTIGLKGLDKKGGVVLKTCDGVHMQLADDCWKPLVEEFVGGAVRKTPSFRVQV
jgi:palmitoyl-protein thioesterase